jgi:decaprenylphospho-beta-D-ribofuranose 2-oxidase
MPSRSDVATLDNHELTDLVSDPGSRGVLVRGLGRSYGDAAQNGGGTIVHLSDATILLDSADGTVRVSAGVSIDRLLREIVPQGFFVPVTAGTRHVTVGGAIASDIHGKNHHRDGSFGNHVRSLRLQLADGSVADISPSERPDLFWATVGGMGLTGIIVDATITLLPIETSRLRVEASRIDDLDTLLTTMEEGDHRYRYSVAWVDVLAKGAHLGRSVLGRGDHATVDELPTGQATDPLAYRAPQRLSVPPLIPGPGVINRLSVAAFNEVWFRKAPRHAERLESIPTFFHPLDAIGTWNRVYGRRGFVQYQVVIPFGAEDTLRRLLEQFSRTATISFLTVLKRFGDANPAPLGFPRPGWTLAVDVPAAIPGVAEVFRDMDEAVLDAGGRHYFAKDAHISPAIVRAGYPRLGEWQAIRDSVDPDGIWQSDLSRRLDLCGRA